eukprot:CAMPEP_0203649176 /NCGR_PEP_ID=MMETSP0088-20131115/21104_1 /ASSEMBLY_ACC=CAM_ASM_001087 /TAXON_ID=426623 /ORGANISM="Chaetoceros affinis, Strain CCMP159" /LENGTH=63 /DNA_ID=CAMNT_0050507469 /DNA_START=72 /DNA_END=263 /DNA_ORIENTATION=-
MSTGILASVRSPHALRTASIDGPGVCCPPEGGNISSMSSSSGRTLSKSCGIGNSDVTNLEQKE